jgi:hypothetical protein
MQFSNNIFLILTDRNRIHIQILIMSQQNCLEKLSFLFAPNFIVENQYKSLHRFDGLTHGSEIKDITTFVHASPILFRL